MDDLVHIVMCGKLAELMVATAPEVYHKYISYGKRGEAELCIRLQKALHGCLKSALLFYCCLVGEMKEIGFELSPFEVIQGRQCTTCWHMDDLKILHWDATGVIVIVDWFKSTYGNVQSTRERNTIT